MIDFPEGFQQLNWESLPEGYNSWGEYWMAYYENERERRRNWQRTVESAEGALNRLNSTYELNVPQNTLTSRIDYLCHVIVNQRKIISELKTHIAILENELNGEPDID